MREKEGQGKERMGDGKSEFVTSDIVLLQKLRSLSHVRTE